ncbi:MAG: hypothetical protein P8012_00240 [Desulfobacterales bacterium]
MKTLRECALELEIQKLKLRIMELEHKIPLHNDVVDGEELNTIAVQDETYTLRKVGTVRGFKNKDDIGFHCVGSTCFSDIDYKYSYYLDDRIIPTIPATAQVLIEMHQQMVHKICKDMETSGINLI